MKKEYMCYCGLYCENCAVKAKIEPAARILHEEMEKAGFGNIIHLIPDGETFWRFLTTVSEMGTCISCQEGSGNPKCAVRLCAQEKGIQMCALCEEYPCDTFDSYFVSYPLLKQDNDFLREKGVDEWLKMQAERRANGFTYTDC